MDLLSALERQPVESQAPDRELADPMGAFALALLQNSHVPGKNTVLSPYSLYLSLAMTANGAKGRTLEQIEGLLGMAVGELNPYMLSFNCAQGSEVADANSLWLHKELPVTETYLQTLRNYFEAQAYTAPFDSETMDAMNQWIEEQTAGRITQAVDQMAPNAMMYLINALTFDGKWNTPYTTNDLTQQSFLAPSGERTVEMMGSEESYYLNCGRGTGFMKDYEGDRYSFFALLPNEGLALGLFGFPDPRGASGSLRGSPGHSRPCHHAQAEAGQHRGDEGDPRLHGHDRGLYHERRFQRHRAHQESVHQPHPTQDLPAGRRSRHPSRRRHRNGIRHQGR